MIKPINHPGKELHRHLIKEVKGLHISYDLFAGDVISTINSLISRSK